ncbi:hypothetical protein [Prosthecobacter sp.]|uniref:hypothetical protein n=1 Tax=Prosthecobacter sp. TaxID=1965333 RepID=UPI00378465C4
MTRFRYFRDAMFLIACLAYGLNRCIIKPAMPPGFMMFHFNDLWLIPCALPPVLWLHRRLGLRADDAPPRPGEITGHLVFWSLLFEWFIPRITHGIGDVCDVAAYTAGAVVAGLWWNRHRWFSAAALTTSAI